MLLPTTKPDHNRMPSDQTAVDSRDGVRPGQRPHTTAKTRPRVSYGQHASGIRRLVAWPGLRSAAAELGPATSAHARLPAPEPPTALAAASARVACAWPIAAQLEQTRDGEGSAVLWSGRQHTPVPDTDLPQATSS